MTIRFSNNIYSYFIYLIKNCRKRIWIIIGYSFRDSIIRNMFTKYLQKKNNKIILVDPNYDISTFFSKFETQIFVIKREFGEKNSFTKTNSLIVNEIENIQ